MHIPSLFYFGKTVIMVFIIASLRCYSQDTDPYRVCGEPYECSSIGNIDYPFWGGGRPSFCGHGDGAFRLDCSRNVPLITIGSITYQVHSLDFPTRTLTLARDDLVDDNCPTQFLGTSILSSNFFSPIDKNHGVALYYGCTQIPGLVTPSSNQFNCSINGTQIVSYFVMNTTQINITEYLRSCRNNILAPVNEMSNRFLSRLDSSVGELRVALSSGFGVQWTGYETFCNQCKSRGGRCGSVTGLDSFTCFRGPSTGFKPWEKLVIGFSVSGGVISMVLVMIVYYRKRRAFMAKHNKQIIGENVQAFLTNHESLAPKQYSYYDIKKMTNSFADKLGEGGYGSVFKGNLFDGRRVAVKVLSDANGDMNDFLNEVDSISRTSHVNIVTLLGFCMERNIRALVYEFMPNKSIDKFMHNTSFPLSSKTMYKIAVGTARGLEYLHQGCKTKIVHFDIKPENILLDEDFCPKIADFGLAKLCQRKSVVSMLGARGTPGYIAPEVFSRSFGEVSHKSDVYSYGMMVINMIGIGERKDFGLDSTKSEMYFPEFIYKRLELMSEDVKEVTVKKMVLVSLWCIQTNPLDRPSMGKVVEMLEGDIGSIRIPPKPFLFSPALPDANQDSSSPLLSSYEIELLET